MSKEHFKWEMRRPEDRDSGLDKRKTAMWTTRHYQTKGSRGSGDGPNSGKNSFSLFFLGVL